MPAPTPESGLPRTAWLTGQQGLGGFPAGPPRFPGQDSSARNFNELDKPSATWGRWVHGKRAGAEPERILQWPSFDPQGLSQPRGPPKCGGHSKGLGGQAGALQGPEWQIHRGCSPKKMGSPQLTVLRVKAKDHSVPQGQAVLRNEPPPRPQLPPLYPSVCLQPWLSGCCPQEADGRKAHVDRTTVSSAQPERSYQRGCETRHDSC